MSDWSDHLTTLFPEVRLKRYLEMRGADGGPWGRLCALPALWVGLLYDDEAMGAAWDLCKDWTADEHDMLRREVPKRALHTPFRGGTIRDVAQQALGIARVGLRNRNRLDGSGNNETGFLRVLDEIVERGSCPAELKLQKFETEWGGDIDRVFSEYAY